MAALVLVAGMSAVCWWGAGIALNPPHMSAMGAFPEQYGLRYQKISFKTKDGLTLRGWFIPSPRKDEERTLLMCHGWSDNKGELLKFTSFLNSQSGFNLLYFDFRSHGESDGHLTTIGYLETIDFDAAIAWLKAEKPTLAKRLGVFGLSMGAAVAAMAVARHPEVKAAVLESPFTTYRGVVKRWAWNRFRVPFFPVMMLVLWFMRLRVGDSALDTASPLRFIHGISPRPILLIGGSQDRLMPPEDVRTLFEAAGEPKQLWIVPGATHAKCHQMGGLEYEARVTNFFNKYL